MALQRRGRFGKAAKLIGVDLPASSEPADEAQAIPAGALSETDAPSEPVPAVFSDDLRSPAVADVSDAPLAMVVDTPPEPDAAPAADASPSDDEVMLDDAAWQAVADEAASEPLALSPVEPANAVADEPAPLALAPPGEPAAEPFSTPAELAAFAPVAEASTDEPVSLKTPGPNLFGFNTKLLDALYQESDAALDLWRAMLDAKSVTDVIRIQASGMTRAMDAAMTSWATLAEGAGRPVARAPASRETRADQP